MTKRRKGLFSGRTAVFIVFLAAVLSAANPGFYRGDGAGRPESRAGRLLPRRAGRESPLQDKGEIKDRIEEIQKEMDLYIKQRDALQGTTAPSPR